jgi:hypothetical protein
MRRRIAACAVAVILLAAIIGCSTTSSTLTPAQQYDLNAYKILAGAKASYETAFVVLAELQKQGKLSDEDAKKAINAGNVFYLIYLVAEAAYETYHKDPTAVNQASLDKNLQDISVKLGEFLATVPKK